MTLAPETTDLKIQLRLAENWLTVCDLGTLTPGRGVAALLPDGRQAASSGTGPDACTRSATATRSPAPPSSPGD